MPNSHLIANGSIHQGDDRFSDVSRGRQCAFMSLSALLCANSCPVSQWTTQTIDRILLEGDAMYVKAFEEQIIPDTERLPLTALPDRVLWCPLTRLSTVEPNQSPIEANKPNQSPIRVTNTNLPIMVEPIEAQTTPNSSLWAVDYKDFQQGRIAHGEHENEAPYLSLNSALMNTFINDNYAFIILDGYCMALFKQTDNSIYVFDSHARNSYGMPDSNGTAVILKFSNIQTLEQYLSCLSTELHSELFEIMPVEFHSLSQFSFTINSCNYKSSCKRQSNKESSCKKEERLRKAREYQKRKISEETPIQRETRLANMKSYYVKRKMSETETEKQTRLAAQNAYKKRKISEESETEKQTRLNARNAYNKRKISEESETEKRSRLNARNTLYKKRKISEESNIERQEQFLNEFNNVENGNLHQQYWAKNNMSKFHQSNVYFVSHCTICREAWPLKSKPRSPATYVCSRCARDKKSPKKFSIENSLIPSSVPSELQGLTQVEEMLIARALPIMRVYIKPGGQRGYSGHCINLPQNVQTLASSLPRYPKDLSVIIVKVKGRSNTFKDVSVRRQKVHDALLWLIHNNPHYSDVEIDEQALNMLPNNGVPSGLLSVETDEDIISDDCEQDLGPPTDNSSEDIVYNESTDMSSFLPVGEQQEQELNAVRNQLSPNEPMSWPTVEDQPLNEYQTSYLATMAFPTLFPDGKGDPTNQALARDVPLAERIKHLIKFAEKVNGKWVYRFASHPRFSYWAFNMIQRKRTLQQSGIFLKQNPGEAHLTIDELREMAASNNSAAFMSKVSRYVANIAGTNAYWHKVKEDLKAIVTNVGTPTLFFTFSSADMHWPDLHCLFHDIDGIELTTSSEERRQNVINNPHIVDWFFTQRLENFIKCWLYDTLNAKWHWYRFEYQGRGSIHCHGTAKLKNDPGLCDLTRTALKGFLAQKLKDESTDVDDPSQLDLDIEAGNEAAETACHYVDFLLSTINPNPPDQDIWMRPQVHPCQRQYKDIPEWDIDSDYVDLLNTVQRHTRCSTNYCLRKKGNESELKCRFHFPFDHCPQTKLEFEKVHSNSTDVQYRAKIVTKRNDSRLNNHQQLQLQGWRANCDIQVVIDHYACVEYLTKYAAKGEPRSPLLKQAFNTIVQNTNNTSNPHKAIKKVVMKTLGERDYAAQETMHHLLSLKLHSSSFNVIPVSLNGSRRVQTNLQEDCVDSCTSNSLLDVYANRDQYDDSQNIIDMNFIKFATTYQLLNGKLKNLPDNVIPRIFPTYSCNPKGPNFASYCKYQLLRYKPWKLTQNNVWGDQEPSDELFISCWHEFLQTPYAQANVPDWFDKLQDVIQSQEEPDDEPVQSDSNTREEWMIISDLHTPFQNTDEHSASSHDWHQDRLGYTDQQIGEMPTWIKTTKEQASTSITPDIHEIVDVNTFSDMQRNAYDIVNNHLQDNSNGKDPLCLIIIGQAGTGKSYLINALRNLLQGKCAVTATTGKASYNIRGITIHSLLKLPVGPRGNKDLTGQSLSRLQESLNGIDYILIDEYSMLGQTTFGWIDKRCKQATGCHDKVLGGISLILIGDPGQLPPVADKPLYHAKPSSVIGEQGYHTYRMFDKVIKLTVNQRVQGSNSEQEQFRSLLLRLRKGGSTNEDWQLLLTRQPSNVQVAEFNNATRLYFSNEEVATYNHEQLTKLQHTVANINARHSSSAAKGLTADDMSGLEPTIFLAKGAKVMLTMNLWANVGLCNGATGTVVDIIYKINHQPPDLPIAVIVKFDDYRGPFFSDTLPSCVPICPITVTAQSIDNVQLERQQLPLRLAYALTIHKSQGLTMPKAWIDIGRSERTPGISYVAISRVKTLSSCVIEPMTFERLTSLKSSTTLQYRLDEEARLNNIAQATCSEFEQA